MLTFNEDQIIEAMQLVVARRRKAQEQHKREAAENFGKLAVDSEAEQDCSTVRSHGKPTIVENR